MYVSLRLLPTSGENFMSTALLEIHLLRKMVMCSVLILPAVCDALVLKLLLLKSDKISAWCGILYPVHYFRNEWDVQIRASEM